MRAVTTGALDIDLGWEKGKGILVRTAADAETREPPRTADEPAPSYLLLPTPQILGFDTHVRPTGKRRGCPSTASHGLFLSSRLAMADASPFARRLW
ncbi:hypothetical protein XA68_13157 [Ophiocordyceps unilateralis]|uniref:Uncharacterized protein n=1 Tax=Ophiocordyceps unilateralis TaxID=268505 RepID=A0A2A9PBN9_OPHUN|nr:hypothetical protein XA68_13157 [Ophiocordyceps unilateralis]